MLSKLTSISYDRVVQWISGPIAGAVGYGFSELVTHVGIVGEIAKGHDADISKAIVQATTFGVGTLVTYAAHHKWMDNIAKWWNSDAAKAESVVAKVDPSASKTVETFVTDADQVIAEILAGQQAAETLQQHPEMVSATTPAPPAAQSPTAAPEQPTQIHETNAPAPHPEGS